MNQELSGLLNSLGLNEEPLAVLFQDHAPADGLCPEPGDLPTRDKDAAGQVDWEAVYANFTCLIKLVWLARKKKKTAWLSAERFGCVGAAFWTGFMKPQAQTIINYVSSGNPGMPGELYLANPEECGRVLDLADPPPAPAPYVVIKPLSLLEADEKPLLVSFFARPETLAGLNFLTVFVTGHPDPVRSPFTAACGGLVAWPLRYLQEEKEYAVLGGWDPSARQFFKTDELSFTVSHRLFEKMLARWEESFLKTPTWAKVQKKIARSQRTWGEA